jgi:hypothetical protein
LKRGGPETTKAAFPAPEGGLFALASLEKPSPYVAPSGFAEQAIELSEEVGAATLASRYGHLLTTHHDVAGLFACCEVVGCSVVVIIGDCS